MMPSKPCQRIVAGPGEHLRHAVGKLVRDFAQRGEQQRVLAAEMKVDRGCGMTGCGRDPCRRERGKAESRNGEGSCLDEIELRAGGPRLHGLFQEGDDTASLQQLGGRDCTRPGVVTQ